LDTNLLPILVIYTHKSAYFPCFILNYRKPLCFPMYFLIIFLCLKREGQGKLLSDLGKYMNNNGDIKKKGRK